MGWKDGKDRGSWNLRLELKLGKVRRPAAANAVGGARLVFMSGGWADYGMDCEIFFENRVITD